MNSTTSKVSREFAVAIAFGQHQAQPVTADVMTGQKRDERPTAREVDQVLGEWLRGQVMNQGVDYATGSKMSHVTLFAARGRPIPVGIDRAVQVALKLCPAAEQEDLTVRLKACGLLGRPTP